MRKLFLLLILAGTTIISFSQNTRTIRECIIEKGVLKEVNVTYDINTGEKTLTYNGVFTKYETLEKSADYAVNKSWYKNSEAIEYAGTNYEKYGLPRILGVTEIKKHGEYSGVGVYIEASLADNFEVIYIPVRQGCEFQPYVKKINNCGDVVITPTIKKIKKGKKVTFTAHVPTSKEKLTYSWKAHSGDIVGKANTKEVAISTTNTTDEIDVEVKVKGPGCESTGYVVVKLD
jgi:hypothetical protein